MSEQAVEVRGLRVRRGRADVFAGLDLDIPRGTITGLLGPSGCGKTTLMRSIVGVQQVAAGTVTVLGAPAGIPALRRRVAYGTQGSSVYGDLTVRQNLRYFARLLGAPRGDVDRALEQVGLTAQTDRLVGAAVEHGHVRSGGGVPDAHPPGGCRVRCSAPRSAFWRAPSRARSSRRCSSCR